MTFWLEEILATARATLGDAAFTEAWTAGQLLPQDEALAAAVAVADLIAKEELKA